MKKPNFFYSIWAIFNDKQQKQLEKIKKKVNTVLKGPYFPIHMTISGGFTGIEKDLIYKMKSTLNGLDQFSIKVENYGYKKTFFQSLYIKVKKNNELILQKKSIKGVPFFEIGKDFISGAQSSSNLEITIKNNLN